MAKYDLFDTKEIEDARKDGARARYEGFPLADNPYGAPDLVRVWSDGWQRFQEVISSIEPPPVNAGGKLLNVEDLA